MLKNADGARFYNLMKLRATRRLLLSGTPVQNSLRELFALLRFLEPGVFDRRVEAVFARDFPVVQAGVLFTSILFVASNLLVDLSYGLVDPRIRDAR